MNNCLFCKIANKEIPSHVVYEDDHTLAFLDIKPCTTGHTVVILKKHTVTLLDTQDVDAQQLIRGVKQATKRIQEVLSPDGFTIGYNHGKVAGQAIDHLHFHILPRWHNDDGGSMHTIIRREPDVSIEHLAERFSS